MSHTLTVNGVSYSQSQRKAASLIVDGWGYDLDGGDLWLDFHEYVAGPQPTFVGPRTVALTDNTATLRFTGDIVSVAPSWSDAGRIWQYHCLGLHNRANQIPVVATDGSGVIVYNLPADSEDYIQANSGLSIGTIVSNVLTSHATALTAAGITTDATTTSQLTALTLVPYDPVYISGERLWIALQNAFRRWNRNGRLIVNAAGLVRVVDMTAGSAHTLTLGTDPVDPPLLSRDWSSCATRVQARGKGKIYPVYVSLALNTLQKAWTAAQQSNWTWNNFAKPADAYDSGTVTTTGGPTSVTVQSSNGSTTWVANYWTTRQAWIYLTKSTGSGLTYTESRPVTANTSLSAAGTSTITLGYALDNSVATAWDKYTLVGTVAPSGPNPTDGLDNVWRLYNVVTPGNWVEQHLVKRFPVPVPFIGLNNASAILTSTPACLVMKGGSGGSQSFRILPATGQVLFDRPVVEQLNSLTTLLAGGSNVVAPDDIYMMLAYSRGALTATYPADVGGVPQYAGTAYSVAGLSRTRTADVESWLYEGNQATMVSLAQMLHGSMKDTVVEGMVRYKGHYSAVMDPSSGHNISIAGNGYTTGDESLAATVRSVTVRYLNTGGGLNFETQIRLSTRKDPRTDESQYMHLSQYGEQFGMRNDRMSVMGGAFAEDVDAAAGWEAQRQRASGGYQSGQEFMSRMGGDGEADVSTGINLSAPPPPAFRRRQPGREEQMRAEQRMRARQRAAEMRAKAQAGRALWAAGIRKPARPDLPDEVFGAPSEDLADNG